MEWLLKIFEGKEVSIKKSMNSLKYSENKNKIKVIQNTKNLSVKEIRKESSSNRRKMRARKTTQKEEPQKR